MRTLATIILVSLGTFAAQAHDIAPTPAAEEAEIPAPEKVISFALLASDEKSFTIRISNHTRKSFTYSGYSPESPIYQIKEHPVGWCGTGVRPQSLEPGQSITFKIHRTMIRDPKTDKIHIEVGGVTSPPLPLK